MTNYFLAVLILLLLELTFWVQKKKLKEGFMIVLILLLLELTFWVPEEKAIYYRKAS